MHDETPTSDLHAAPTHGHEPDGHLGGGCGCAAGPGESGAATGPGGHAVGMDPALKKTLLTRLRRIEGQVRGLQKMIDEERWCADILVQVNAAQEALRGVSRGLLRNHLEHCAAAAVRAGDATRADEVFDELTELMFKSVR